MAKVTVPKPQELAKVNYQPPAKGWMDVKPEFRPGTYVNAAQPKWLEMINYPYPRAWSVPDEDWKLPPADTGCQLRLKTLVRNPR